MSRKRSDVGVEVFVQESPVSSIKQKGNLTGNVRVLRDHVTGICDLIHQWDEELIVGVSVISEIKNLMSEKIENLKNLTDFPHTSQLQSCVNKLEKICERMEFIVERLGQKSSCILSIQRLEENRNSTKLAFLTWPITKFVRTSQEIYEMFRKEIELKITIKEQICFSTDKNLLTFYSTAWFHQPYIKKSVNHNFEAMLKEVGLPSIHDKPSQ